MYTCPSLSRLLSIPDRFTNRLEKSNAMKTYRNFSLAMLLVTLFSPMLLSADNGWDNRFPGDDFSLEGALQLFKNANNLEDFEQALNSPDNDVNNLDLNGNGRIDYLRVVDHQEGDVHAIVIQDLLDHNTAQDVAVIEVKRTYNGEAMVQIIGDVDLYGTEKIVEPYPYDDQFASSYNGYDDDYYYDSYDRYDRYYRYDNYSSTVFVNVMLWPSVRFIYSPRYVVWVSPWHWDYYPRWYQPWRPQPWNVWYPRVTVYHQHYRVAPECRIPEARRYYAPRRQNAPAVHERTQHIIQANGGRTDDRRSRNSAPNVTTKQGRDRATVAQTPSRKGNVQRETSPVRQPNTNSRSTDSQNISPYNSRPQDAKQPRTNSRKTPAATPQAPRSNSRPSDNKGTNSRVNSSHAKTQPAKKASRSNQVQRTPSAPKVSSPKPQPRTESRTKASSASRSSDGKATSAKQPPKKSRKQ